jgi:hypothetical protein
MEGWCGKGCVGCCRCCQLPALIWSDMLLQEVERLRELVGEGEAQRALLSADTAELRRQLEAQRGAVLQAQVKS